MVSFVNQDEVYQISTISNGLKVVTRSMREMNSVSVGIWISAGSRYEYKRISGISHFLEHLLFKGTKKRTCQQIKNAIEGKGGTLNAFTSEEMTCYWARVVKYNLKETLDVLSDMVIAPLLKSEDVEKEREVIKEEIKMYQDLPGQYIHSLFDQLLWPNQPLGFMIAGTIKSVDGISRKDIKDYIKKLYTPKNIVISVAGNVDHDDVCVLAERIFSQAKAGKRNAYSKVKEEQKKPCMTVLRKDTAQTHLCLGTRTFKRGHKDKYVLSILNIILGGNMSSRLFEELREKRGLCYEIRSSLERYYDTGAFVVSAGVDIRNLEKSIELILKELEKIKTKGISKREFARSKDFVVGQFLLGQESTLNQMNWMGENLLCTGKVPKKDEILEHVKKVRVDDVVRVAQNIFTNSRLNLTVIGPVEKEASLKKMLRLK